MKHLTDFVELRPMVISHMEAMKKLSGTPAGVTIRTRRK
jgi:hypothetical protein